MNEGAHAARSSEGADEETWMRNGTIFERHVHHDAPPTRASVYAFISPCSGSRPPQLETSQYVYNRDNYRHRSSVNPTSLPRYNPNNNIQVVFHPSWFYRFRFRRGELKAEGHGRGG